MEFFGKRGSSGIGYGLIVGLISVVALGAITGVGQQTDDLFGSVGTTLDDVVQENVSFPSPVPSTSASPPTTGTSCLDIFNGGQTVSGTYTLDPDGPGGDPSFSAFCNMTQRGGGWTQCFGFTNTSGEDLTSSDAGTFFNDCVDFSMASWTGTEIMLAVGNQDSPDYVAAANRIGSWTYTNVTGSGSSQHQYTNHANRITLDTDSDVLSIAGAAADSGGCGGDWAQGYTIRVRDDDNGTYYDEIIVAVAAYLRPTGVTRSFTGWTQSNELSYNGSPFSTCTSSPGYLGDFGFYVR